MTTKIDQEEEKVYSTHDYVGPLSPSDQATCEAFRNKFKEVESLLLHLPIEDRSASDRFRRIALTKLEEAGMYAIKAIEFRGKKVR